MNNTMTRAKIYTTFVSHELAHKYMTQISLEECRDICKKIVDYDLQISTYENIQKIMFEDSSILPCIKRLQEDGYSLSKLDNILGVCDKKFFSLADTSFEEIVCILEKDIDYEVSGLYLEFYSNLGLENQKKDVVLSNLNKLGYSKRVEFSQLTQDERGLLTTLKFHHSVPYEGLIKFVQFLSGHPESLLLVTFLEEEKLGIGFTLENWMEQAKCTKIMEILLRDLVQKIDKTDIKKVISYWMENGGHIKELELITDRLCKLQECDRITCGSYMKILLGNKMNFDFSILNQVKEKLIIYAMVHKKKRFLSIVEKNPDLLLRISDHSVIFDSRFREILNINTLSIENIRKCAGIESSSNLSHFSKTNTYTFNEFIVLYPLSSNYHYFYSQLDMRMDGKLRMLRQFVKRSLLVSGMGKEQIQSLAGKLKEHDIYYYKDKVYSYIKGVTLQDVVNILASYQDIKKLLPQVKTSDEVFLLYHNHDRIKDIQSIQKLKNKIIRISESWSIIKVLLQLSDDFMKLYADTILVFVQSKKADYSLKYMNQLVNPVQREAFGRVVKAQLMGRFLELKYYGDDLEKELEYKLSESEKRHWQENTSTGKSGILVREVDDFEGTLLLGEQPEWTCLSYRSGSNNECLLSAFDSNKKVLYAYRDGNIIGRAIVRLSKFGDGSERNTLEFQDLENNSPMESKKEDLSRTEQPLIFLERLYASGNSIETVLLIRELMLKLMEQKAKGMGTNFSFAACSEYMPAALSAYVSRTVSVFVSKSKGGPQYWDSFKGKISIEAQGTYKSGVVSFWMGNQNTI